MKSKGLIQIYTGEGKGKTTAAVGLACRAVAHNLKVGYIYFHKNPTRWEYGELESLRKLGVDVFGFAKEHPHFSRQIDRSKIRKDCLHGLQFIEEVYREQKYDILILDEINISVREGFLNQEEVLEMLDAKPQSLELILTGRDASLKIIDRADLVSEVKNVKHPYEKGVQRRKGIEY